MANSVCYQCQERHAGCHATCEKGIAEEKRNEEIRRKRFLDNIENDSVRLKAINRKNMHDKKAGRKT